MNQRFEALGMEMKHTMLENGLHIYYIPKPGFSKTFAMLATNFGAVDRTFTMDGVTYHTPAGVAHFLEHKMFEDADGNALQKFGQTGASPNAFTSYAMTAYYFSCTDAWEQNLDILFRFVFTPYFTEENVQKEKGIIAQEINMMEDTPSWKTYVGVFEGMYHTHPVNTSIAGSVQSIAEITPEILFLCHKAFYSPANMSLIVSGNADFDRIVQMAESLSPKTAAKVAARQYGVRQENVAAAEVTHYMSVSRPSFMLGIKDLPLAPEESHLRRQLVGDLAARILCGNTAPLFVSLYQERLVTRGFESSYALLPDAAAALLGGESNDPYAVRDRVAEQVQRYAAQGIEDGLFDRMKKACYGLNVRVLDQPDELCRAQAESSFAGECCLDFAKLYDTITKQEVQQMFVRWAQPDRMTLSVVLPAEAKERKAEAWKM